MTDRKKLAWFTLRGWVNEKMAELHSSGVPVEHEDVTFNSYSDSARFVVAACIVAAGEEYKHVVEVKL